MYKRAQLAELLARIAEPRKFITVISGPRQVGKSTMVKQALQETTIKSMFVTADSVPKENTAWLGEVWDTARAHMQIGGLAEYLLVIDEVHKINNWSEEVKKQWDTDTLNDVNLKVVLLGSSRLLLKDGLTESLAGRYEIIHMPHWSYREMHEAFGLDLEHYIFYGGYPGAASLIDNEPRWRRYIKDSIVAPAIERDILITKTIYKPELMRQLFELGCTYSGEEISLTKLLGQLQDAGNVTTLAGYLTTLKESQLLCGSQKYANDNARRYNSVPKLYVYNNALLSALSGAKFEKVYTTSKDRGRWIESAVGTHILSLADKNDYKVYYWREADKEVDFVVESNGRFIAIEVKSGRRTSNDGLPTFVKRYGPERAFVVGSGGIPVEEFLQLELDNLF